MKTIKKITYTIETLYHFSCEKCKKWWSIGDPFWSSYKTMTCPHCGEESKLERKGITPGAGFSDEEKEK